MKQVKEAYVNFLNHCYVDTEVEMKEIYASNHMWTVFEKSFLPDMNKVADQVAASVNVSTGSPITTANLTRTKSHRQLTKYVCDALITVIGSFFGSPFSSTAAAAAAAAAASSTSSTDHHHHRLQTGGDDGSSGSSSAVIAAAASAANTNATAVVQVSVLIIDKRIEVLDITKYSYYGSSDDEYDDHLNTN